MAFSGPCEVLKKKMPLDQRKPLVGFVDQPGADGQLINVADFTAIDCLMTSVCIVSEPAHPTHGLSRFAEYCVKVGHFFTDGDAQCGKGAHDSLGLGTHRINVERFDIVLLETGSV